MKLSLPFNFFQMDDEEEKYICPHHHLDIHTAECLCRHEEIVRNIESGRPPGHIHRTDSDVEELSRRFTGLKPSVNDSDEPINPPPPDYEAVTDCATQNGFHSSAGVSRNSGVGGGSGGVGGGGGDRPNRKESLIAAMASPIMTPVASASAEEEDEDDEEVVWLRREEVNQEPLLKKSKSSLSPSSSSSTFYSNKQKQNKQFKQVQQHYRNHSFEEILPADDDHNHHITEITSSTGLSSKMPRRGILKRGGGNRRARAKAKCDHFARIVAKSCRREQSLALRKEIVVEWQTIATVIDRLLFWIFLLATVVAYLVILVFVPMTKPDFPSDMPAIHAFVRNTPPHS